MASYTYSQLYGPGIIGENISGTVTFTFHNITTGSIGSPYFWDTTPENWNEYNLNWNDNNNNPIVPKIDGDVTYFVMETIKNHNGVYDSSSPLNFNGTYNASSSMNLISSPYITAVIVNPGYSSFTFTPTASVTGTTYYLRGTGMYSLVIS